MRCYPLNVGGYRDTQHMSDSNKPKVQLHEYSEGLDLDTHVWRYLSLDAALVTLNSSNLRFTRLGAFPDEYEGTEDFDSIAAHRIEAEQFAAQFNEPIMHRNPEITKILNQRSAYASCWSLNPPTDMVMWRSYASGLSSVALESTVGKLMNCLLDVPGVSAIGAIRYKPSQGLPIANLHFQDKCFEKYDAYAFEREVRLCISLLNEPRRPEQLENYPDHHSESVNVEFIDALALHPLMPVETQSMVVKVLSALAPGMHINKPAIAYR